MPVILSYTHTLLATDHATRVRLTSSSTTPINVEVGSAAETWPEGTYIEILSLAANAPVSFISNDATLNVYGSSSIAYGEYARVSLVSPGVWDLHVYPHPTFVPFIPSLLGELEDVDSFAYTPNDGDLLTFNSSSGIWEAASLALGRLSDVDDFMYAPDDGDVLTYNSGAGMWEATPPAVQQTSFKPRPLEQQTITGPVDFGSALHHNTSYRAVAGTDVYVTVQPDSFWTGTEEWWENGNSPTSPGPMPPGGSALFGKHDVGNVVFVAGSGVTINTPDTLTVNKLHGKVTLIKVAPNVWDLEGNLASA